MPVLGVPKVDSELFNWSSCAQNASAVAVSACTQFGAPWFAHPWASSALLNVPPVQASHVDESAVAAPSV